MITLHDTLLCAHCNAPLAGVPLDGGCTQCSSPVAATIDLSVIDSKTGEINGDASCIHCGYNLRSLALGGVCPECGRPVTESLRPDVLCLAEPGWRKNILKGINLLLLTGIAIPAIFGTILLVRTADLYISSAVTMILGGLAIVILGFIAVGGIVCLSSRDATRIDDPKRFWPHSLAGVLPLINILWAVILFAFGSAVFYLGQLGMIVLSISFFLLQASVLLNLVAITACLRKVATRARAPRLRKATLWWVLGFTGTVILGIVTNVIGAYGSFGSNPAYEFLLGLVALAACTLYILSIVGLGTYRKLLHEADIRFTAVAESVKPRPIQSADAA